MPRLDGTPEMPEFNATGKEVPAEARLLGDRHEARERASEREWMPSHGPARSARLAALFQIEPAAREMHFAFRHTHTLPVQRIMPMNENVARPRGAARRSKYLGTSSSPPPTYP